MPACCPNESVIDFSSPHDPILRHMPLALRAGGRYARRMPRSPCMWRGDPLPGVDVLHRATEGGTRARNDLESGRRPTKVAISPALRVPDTAPMLPHEPPLSLAVRVGVTLPRNRVVDVAEWIPRHQARLLLELELALPETRRPSAILIHPFEWYWALERCRRSGRGQA